VLGDFEDFPPPRHPISGKITLDGKPLNKGTLQFFHTVEVTWTPYETIRSDGTFSSKMPVGSYHVVIDKSDPEVPEKYRTPGRSGLMIEIKEGENTFDFDLVTE